jgi:hypothetical protein
MDASFPPIHTDDARCFSCKDCWSDFPRLYRDTCKLSGGSEQDFSRFSKVYFEETPPPPTQQTEGTPHVTNAILYVLNGDIM